MIYRDSILKEVKITSEDIVNRCVLIDCDIEEGAIVQRSKVIVSEEVVQEECDCESENDSECECENAN